MLPFQYIYVYSKRKFVFLGQQIININRRLLCKQMCPTTACQNLTSIPNNLDPKDQKLRYIVMLRSGNLSTC